MQDGVPAYAVPELDRYDEVVVVSREIQALLGHEESDRLLNLSQELKHYTSAAAHRVLLQAGAVAARSWMSAHGKCISLCVLLQQHGELIAAQMGLCRCA